MTSPMFQLKKLSMGGDFSGSHSRGRVRELSHIIFYNHYRLKMRVHSRALSLFKSLWVISRLFQLQGDLHSISGLFMDM